jgi:cellulose synthase/poly-beta-1,6-N-acetylglucosamine synthase-like glycosyltransferase
MEALIWSLRTTDGSLYSMALVKVLCVLAVLCWDYPVLLGWRLLQRSLGKQRSRQDEAARSLPLLVVIPSLLRQRDELESMQSTVRGIVSNGYPGELTLVLSIDGTADAPQLVTELKRWAQTIVAELAPNQRFYVTGTSGRHSKPMAIEHAMGFVKRLVAKGELPAFPPVYVSTDADADLGPDSLRRIVARLQRRNRVTGSPARVVAGALHVRGDDFWRGLRGFFSIGGQLNLQVAREYYVGNIWRYNIRWLPITGVPGAFYCTWSELFLTIPNYLGYIRTLRRRDWLLWWIGVEPPRFSGTRAAPLPEMMAGDTDDTVSAYAALIAQYNGGRWSFDAPRTPLHAFGRMLMALFVDRALAFEPEARVFTSSPTRVKTLFRQRKRWNSSRVELTGRFWPALGYHWALGLPVLIVKMLLARTILVGIIAYVAVPAVLWDSHQALGFALILVANWVTFSVLTVGALAINHDWQYWRLLLSLPLAPIYQIVFNWLPGTVGVLSDVLLFGNRTGFAPEWTLRRGGTSRIALAYRVRRFIGLAYRSVRYGGIPFGSFWFGWHETRWTPNGYDGWTQGSAPPKSNRTPGAVYVGSIGPSESEG